MKTTFFLILIVLLSCRDIEKESLLKIQNEYIEELKTKRKNIDAAITSNYRDGRLKLDFLNFTEKF